MGVNNDQCGLFGPSTSDNCQQRLKSNDFARETTAVMT